ncbi:MAG: DUF2793 domain-containing protein [Beijerinckiaceae bacterium]|nr:DUF2793 domain-containing protein [Beijerinckiaceae bacterium]MCZ8298738.1 DUF2793 domain-containing protein [Beijerinckiaceae bacterium]
MDETPLLSLPYLAAGQAQKHVTLNESLRRLDMLVQLSARSRVVGLPPEDPGEGARFLVPEGATGAWQGRAGQVAAWQDGGWVLVAPGPGWLAWIEDEARLLAFTLAGWVPAIGPLQDIDRLGIGTRAEGADRLAVRGMATLLTHDGEGHQLKLNKAMAAATASLLFQTGWSGRAEIGTVANDALAFKMSADGQTWLTALVIQPDGRVGLGGITAPSAALHLSGALRLGAVARAALPDPVTSGAGALIHVTDAPGGAVVCFSDGALWRRVTDRVPVS